MKIAYLSECVFPSTTTNSLQVMKMCEAMAWQGHEMLVVGVAGSDGEGRGHFKAQRMELGESNMKVAR